jgi:hypothetical protein
MHVGLTKPEYEYEKQIDNDTQMLQKLQAKLENFN